MAKRQKPEEPEPVAAEPTPAEPEPAAEPVEAGVPSLADKELRTASDVGATGGEGALWNDVPRVPAQEILGLAIDILDMRLMESTLRPGEKFAVLRFRALRRMRVETVEGTLVLKKGDEATTSTGSGRIVDQLQRPGVQFPFAAQIRVKPGKRYWELADPAL